LRLGYFFGMMILFLFTAEAIARIFGFPIPNYHQLFAVIIFNWFVSHPIITASMALGFVTGGAVHSIADWIVTGGKHLWRVLFVPPGQSARVARKSAPSSMKWLFNPFTRVRPDHF
jgi:hypothetical protein